MKFAKLVSLTCALVLLLGSIVVGTAVTVRNSLNSPKSQSARLNAYAYYISTFPEIARRFFTEDFGNAYLVNLEDIPGSNTWQGSFPSIEDSGFLLFAGYDFKVQSTVSRLIRISDGAVLLDWNIKAHGPAGITAYLAPPTISHPILLAGGDIVVNLDGKLMRLRTCKTDPVWVLSKPTHHSNELAANGDILTAAYFSETPIENRALASQITDNSLLRVSPDGHVLSEESFSQILLDNGFRDLLFGHFGMQLNADPIHLNEIAEAPTTTAFWEKGDLLISARHLSTVFLYRPSTKKIIWHQTGPWLNQHDASFVNGKQIAVFDNNAATIDADTGFLSDKDINQVMVFDFETNQILQPYQKILEKLRPRSATEGRAQILSDGSLFFEETSNGRIFKVTPDTLQWSFINRAGPHTVAQLRWSRYYTRDEIMALLPKFSLDGVKGKNNGCL